MKLLWYIDSIAYKENKKSLTVLVYTHQKMGALPISYDELLKLPSIKVEEEIIDKENYSVCCHILPNENYKLKVKLTESEKEICNRVINKFKNFTTKELINYMHNEKTYTDTKPNEVIDFSYAKFVEI
ncbi:Panacea domain-containing protein [Gemella morbillorum]